MPLERAEILRRRAEHYRGLAACDEEEAALLQSGEEPGGDFTSERRPSNCSRPLFNRVCRSGAVVGATKVGGRGGGIWTCSRAAWFRARTKRPNLSLVPTAKTETEAEVADKLIEQAGFRLSARGAR